MKRPILADYISLSTNNSKRMKHSITALFREFYQIPVISKLITLLPCAIILTSVLCVSTLAEDGPTEEVLQTGRLPASSRAAMEKNVTAPFITADPDWYVWGGSVIRAEDGSYHMFGSRWPKVQKDGNRGMRGWLYVSEIAHYTATKPEGPYKYESTVLKGFGNPQADRWDAYNAHNPCVTRMKDPDTGKMRYYLYYIANRDDNLLSEGEGVPAAQANDWWDRIIMQRVGVAVADSLNGPWTRHAEPVISPPTGPLNHYLVNPGIVQLPDGAYLMCLKGRSDSPPFGSMIHGWALADRPEGPFVAQETLLFSKNILAEDPCVWVKDNYVHAAVKDWKGGVSGTPGIARVRAKLSSLGGIPKGGLKWEIPKNSNLADRSIKWDDGEVTELDAIERPFILLDEHGNPSHLFTAASVHNPFASRDNIPFNLCQPLIKKTVPKSNDLK